MSLPAPHGGALRRLVVAEDKRAELRDEALGLPTWDLAQRQVWDLELLLSGGFSPLSGFMVRRDHASVCETMRLADGMLWPIPVTLDVTHEFARPLAEGSRIALRQDEGQVLAILTVEDLWLPDAVAEAEAVTGTANEEHPHVFQLRNRTGPVYLGGRLEGIESPAHHTFRDLRHEPSQLRTLFQTLGWTRVVAFQTRNPLHRAHVELLRRAAEDAEANVLLHPVVGRTQPGDLDHYSRVRCYQAVMPHLPVGRTVLSLLPLAMRMAGPREALWHALVRKNHGCSHFIVGRDHAGPRDAGGRPFYAPDAAKELVALHESEAGIQMVPFEEMVYVPETRAYQLRSEVSKGCEGVSLSGTELRRELHAGRDIPEWFSFPEVVRELRKRHPARSHQGFTVFFTGLSGAGKSTIANVLMAHLLEIGTRPVTLLDGDVVRKHLSSELGFSREHRDLNIRRIGYVASEITKNRGLALCALIAPYRAARREVREMVAEHGGFFEVHVATPLKTCEARDRKGLYALARAGRITGFTGIDDPYEAPEHAEVVIDASSMSPEACAQVILRALEEAGYIETELPASLESLTRADQPETDCEAIGHSSAEWSGGGRGSGSLAPGGSLAPACDDDLRVRPPLEEEHVGDDCPEGRRNADSRPFGALALARFTSP